MKEIPLTQGKVALVDDEDFALVSRHKWHAQRSGDGLSWYAKTTLKGKRRVAMHRLIMNAPEGLEVDHINGDKLDNRRANLRLATRDENARNLVRHRDSESPYKGVTYHKRHRCWVAKLGHEGRIIHLGYYDDPVDAARAYDAKAREMFGAFASLNFPDSTEQPKGRREKHPTSPYRGVAWVSTRNIWTARVLFQGKRVFVGNFKTAEEAARAYDAKAKELLGADAKLNFS